ncbi:MAG: SDR family oxidoreductase, partial [Clostridiales Family XIII bacterium]|nr:SDR family oxidoreductase [Clostridiales Family XIII bacterium]
MGKLFQDKVVIVTGSGQGIGRAVALAFAAEGAKVVTNNRKPGSTGRAQLTDEQYAAMGAEDRAKFDKAHAEVSGDAETTAAAIRSAGGEAVAVFANIVKMDEAKRVVDAAVEHFGGVDILVNVAGAFGSGPLHELTEEDWDRVTSVKVKGYFNMMKFAIPHMQKKQWGRIINTTSKALMGDIIRMAHYCAANAAAMGLTQGAACEYFAEGITVNSFAPWARTRASYEADFAFHGDSAVGDLGEFPTAEQTPPPESITPFILYLCTDEAKDITGTNFTLAGNSINMNQYPTISKSIS